MTRNPMIAVRQSKAAYIPTDVTRLVDLLPQWIAERKTPKWLAIFIGQFAMLLGSFAALLLASQFSGCVASPRPNSSSTSMAAVQHPVSGNESGWESVSFVDLVKASNAECIIESRILVRCAGSLQINALSKTSVHGDGTRVEFSDSRPGKGGIVLNGASDVVLSNIEIGWLGGGARDASLPGIQRIQSLGNVIACGSGETGGVLSLDLPLGGTVGLGAVSVWDDKFGWPWYRSAPDAVEVYFPQGATAGFSAGKSNCLPQLSRWIGRRVLLRHSLYAYPALFCSGCQNVTVEKVRVTSAPGMAFVFANGGSGLTLRGDVVEPRCAPTCSTAEPSVTADAAHFANVEGNILLENNNFGWQGDDSVNITGLLAPARVDRTEGLWLVVDPQWQSHTSLMAVGSKVLLFDRGLSALGEASIIATETTAGRLKMSWLPPNVGDLIMARADGVPRNVVIRNNRFHDHRARGILMGGSGALIEKNFIERVTMEAILVPADTGPWYEGPGAKHVKIIGNTISDVNRFPAVVDYPSAISAGLSISKGYIGTSGSPIQDIVVEGNSFSNIHSSADKPVYIGRGVLDADVRQ